MRKFLFLIQVVHKIEPFIVKVLTLFLVVISSIFIKYLWGLQGLDFSVSVIASLFAALIAGMAGYFFRGVTYKKALRSAPEKYVDHLDTLIRSAVSEGDAMVVINAEAIVSTRDDLQESLTSLSKLLNSDIDRLKDQLKTKRNRVALREITQVLEKKWPSKKDQIEIEIRKLFAELGLKEII